MDPGAAVPSVRLDRDRRLRRPLQLLTAAAGTAAGDDRGSVAVLMCFIVAIGAALVGCLVYAGAGLEAANRADTYSSEAARAASIAIGPLPDAVSDPTAKAAAAARAYLQEAGATGWVSVTGPATVRVTVTATVESLFGTPVSQTRTHTAQLQIGVTSGEGVK
jgi:Flp pilus assembly protein TadG